MAHIAEMVKPVAERLIQAALQRKRISTKVVFGLFNHIAHNFDELYAEEIYTHAVFDTLKVASKSLSEHSEVIYSALVFKPSTGIPGSWFFSNKEVQGRDFYSEIAGTLTEHDLMTVEHRDKALEIVRRECLRVHEHAVLNYSG